MFCISNVYNSGKSFVFVMVLGPVECINAVSAFCDNHTLFIGFF